MGTSERALVAVPILNIELTSGRRIWARALRQRFTYDGLVEGLPSDEFNRWHLERRVRAFLELDCRFHLLDVQMRNYRYTPGDLDHLEQRLPRRDYAHLPPIETTVQFESERIMADPAARSRLTIGWYQEDFGLPGEAIREQLRAVEWEGLAEDFFGPDLSRVPASARGPVSMNQSRVGLLSHVGLPD